MPDWPSYGVFGVSPLLIELLKGRSEINQNINLNTQEGIWAGIAWLFSIGLVEFQISTIVGLDLKLIKHLDQPYPLYRKSSSDRALTWLMFFLWRTENILKINFDLSKKEDRARYVAWFMLEGIDEYQLQDWVGDKTKRLFTKYWNDIKTRTPELKITKYERSNKKQLIQPKFGVNIIGFALGELGIGEDARMAVAACQAVGIPFKVINISPGSNVRQNDSTLLHHLDNSSSMNNQDYSVNLFCLTGFETARIYLENGPSMFQGKYNIGWWPWELPVWPKKWECVLPIVDEIWAATRFTLKMYSQTIKKARLATNVSFMPMAVTLNGLEYNKDINKVRKRFCLPSDAFIYLFIFDFNSYIERKNPIAIVEAFKCAFKSAEHKVALVIKTMNVKKEDPKWNFFVSKCHDSRIYILDETIDRFEVISLINASDAYVSLHRSEGFGRTMAEAMLLDKPVIATNFSGNRDFVTKKIAYPVKCSYVKIKEGDYPYVSQSDNAWWADANIFDAADLMKKAYFLRRKKSPSDFINMHYSSKCVGNKMKERLTQISQVKEIEWAHPT